MKEAAGLVRQTGFSLYSPSLVAAGIGERGQCSAARTASRERALDTVRRWHSRGSAAEIAREALSDRSAYRD